jgi:hypothetical protein
MVLLLGRHKTWKLEFRHCSTQDIKLLSTRTMYCSNVISLTLWSNALVCVCWIMMLQGGRDSLLWQECHVLIRGPHTSTVVQLFRTRPLSSTPLLWKITLATYAIFTLQIHDTQSRSYTRPLSFASSISPNLSSQSHHPCLFIPFLLHPLLFLSLIPLLLPHTCSYYPSPLISLF